MDFKKKIMLAALSVALAAVSLAGCGTNSWKQTAFDKRMSAAISGYMSPAVWDSQRRMSAAISGHTVQTVWGSLQRKPAAISGQIESVGKQGSAAAGETQPDVGKGEPSMARLSEKGHFAGREARGSAVLEDQGFVYFYDGCEVRKISKEDQEVSVIWKSGETEEVSLGRSAVLTGGRIFFLENWWVRGRIREFLSVVNTDGTGYERIEEKERPGGFLYFSEGNLYVEDGSSRWGQGIYMNGSSVWEYGISTDGTWDKVRSLTGYAYRVLPDALKTGAAAFSNKDYLLLEQEGELYLTDRETQESRRLAEYGGSVIGMDEEYVYLRREDPGADAGYCIVYEKIRIEDGEKSILFVQDGFSDVYMICNITGPCGMGQTSGGYIYYVEEADYRLYLTRRSLADPSYREVLGDAFFDSGVSEVGRVEKYYAETLSEVNPDWGHVTVDLERLVVDESFPGAADINRFLTEIQENIILHEEEKFLSMEENLKNTGEKMAIAAEKEGFHFREDYSYNSVLSPVFCYGDRYLSFYQDDDEYNDGALHGSLCRRGYTFDLLTGERLALGDVVGNSGEEINEIVTRYFTALIGEHPEAFWDNAVDIVRESVGMGSDFYLKEEGICFYLPPYAIAAFAGGFQEVTVPYEEFEMKIM